MKFGEARAYPGMNGIPVIGPAPETDPAVMTEAEFEKNPIAYICQRCSALVASREQHVRWHNGLVNPVMP